MYIDDEELQNLSKSELIDAYSRMKRSRDRVFSIASHDLRSPFSGLLGLSEMLSSGFRNMSPEELSEYICTMRDSLKNTYQLLENLFEWGRIERQKYDKTIETIPCRIVIEEILEELSTAISSKEISIKHEYDQKILVETNSKMMEFVLKNLISNAVKYSERGSAVTLSCLNTDEGFILSVQDRGVGISEENQSRLFSFESTWKMHGTEGEAGTGLGLLASSRIAECFGGKLSVESAPGKGSTFRLILPVPRAQ